MIVASYRSIIYSHSKTVLVIVGFFSALECLSDGGRKIAIFNL